MDSARGREVETAIPLVGGTVGALAAALGAWARRRLHRRAGHTVPETIEEREVDRLWDELNSAVAEAGPGPPRRSALPGVGPSEQEVLDRLLQEIANAKRAFAYVAEEWEGDAMDAALKPLRTLEVEMASGPMEAPLALGRAPQGRR